MNASTWDFVEAYSNPVPADVRGALEGMGVEVLREMSRPDSTEYLARCPLHLANTGKVDRRPSFWVNSHTGAHLCFSCGYSGPFVALVADVLGCEREEAVRWIARRGVYRTTAEDRAPAAEPEPRVSEAHLGLFEPPPEHALADRHLTPEAAAACGILWDPRTDRWILPIRSPDGTLLGWQEKGPGHFRNRPAGVKKSTCLFGPLDADVLVLVESPLCAARIRSLGIPGAVAAFGAGVSEAQMLLILRHAKQLILALDNDPAGITARDRLYTIWRPRGLPIRFYDYTGADGKDPGDCTDDQIRRGIDRAHRPWRRA